MKNYSSSSESSLSLDEVDSLCIQLYIGLIGRINVCEEFPLVACEPWVPSTHIQFVKNSPLRCLEKMLALYQACVWRAHFYEWWQAFPSHHQLCSHGYVWTVLVEHCIRDQIDCKIPLHHRHSWNIFALLLMFCLPSNGQEQPCCHRSSVPFSGRWHSFWHLLPWG